MQRFIVFIILFFTIFSVTACRRPTTTTPLDFDEAREKMITRDLIPRGINNRMVLKSMGEVKREDFVPPEYRDIAYEDRTIRFGTLSTISQPYIVALMTEAIEPEPGQKVLEIGTASGYQAAVLSKIVKDVYTIEIDPTLAKNAKIRLENLGYKNVHVKAGDGFYGWEENAPFDGIIVTCSAAKIPEKLFEQLAEGGNMVIPLGETFSVQTLTVITKRNGNMDLRPLMDVRFVPMQGEIKKEVK